MYKIWCQRYVYHSSMFPVSGVYLRSFFQGAKTLPVNKIMFPYIKQLDKEEKEV